MDSYRFLFETPELPRILETLLREGRVNEEILTNTRDRGESVRVALAGLEEHGLVARGKGMVTLIPGKEVSSKVEKILSFYREVERVQARKLLFRGILSVAPYECLVHRKTFFAIMENEGFGEAGVRELLRSEFARGFVEYFRIVSPGRAGGSGRTLSFVPLHCTYFLTIRKEAGETGGDAGAGMDDAAGEVIRASGEGYLLGRYPQEVVRQAREYITMEKPYIYHRIATESIDIYLFSI